MRLLLSLFIAVAPTLATAQTSSGQSETMALVKDYHACLDAHLLLFERAKESAGDTTEAILAACNEERATIVLNLYEKRKADEPNYPIAEAEAFVNELFVEPKRGELLVELFRERSK